MTRFASPVDVRRRPSNAHLVHGGVLFTNLSIPGPTGQGERICRTTKEATVKHYYYNSHDQLKVYMHSFLMTYNFVKRLKTLKGLTPYEYICKIWTREPERFKG